ncbi:MAG: hypothetical protein O2956_03065 [Gemmatimonadetes bacterium]|nr:hypothetical protein [Gemmatimonadota bacterium]
MRKHLLAIAVILTVATGCDNVAWGGIDVELKPPPPSSRTAVDADEPAGVVGPVNVAGPILLAGTRTGARADFVIVGEVHPGVLREFPHPAFPDDTTRLEEVTAPGSEWILFSEGVRVGRMVADAVRPAEGFCGARTVLSGFVELVPTASGAERLLALPAESSAQHPYGNYAAIAHDYDQRVATLAVANRAIPANGAAWPPLGVLDARDHIQAFQLIGSQGRSVAATFLHQDELTVASPRQGAYSLFLMSQQVGASYEEGYVWYRSVESEGKGAPRYFDHLDWDGNGSDDILLDVFGPNRRWFAVLSQRDGSWARTFEDPCGSGSATGG